MDPATLIGFGVSVTLLGVLGLMLLHLITTGQPALATLQELSGNRYQDLSGLTSEHRLAAIRSLELDVAVDLAGWTGGNNSECFAAGLAPLQVNYLGYFASTGITFFEMAIAWWWPAERLRRLGSIEGLEHLRQAEADAEARAAEQATCPAALATGALAACMLLLPPPCDPYASGDGLRGEPCP